MEQFNNYTVKVTNEEWQARKPEVLIMVGDDDEGMDLQEVVRVKKNLPKSDLWILPNVAHGAHEGETKEEFILKAKAFFSRE
jgi:pimeloyl-ACP methyl ester carboxylesterase